MLGTFAMSKVNTEWKAGDLLSVAQTADYLDLSRQRVHQFIKSGRFPSAYKIGEFWVIPFEDVDNLEPLEGGRPKKNHD